MQNSINPLTTDIPKLSFDLDKVLIPTENEKNNHAEVSTPYALRRLMLNQLPPNFWTRDHTCYEPCCGKGGFVIDIISRFMEGLEMTIENPQDRYKHIVENLIYFNDINPDNVNKVKQILDPDGIYDLNYSQDDSLTTNHFDRRFDLVVMNPPYNKGSVQRGSVLYTKFIRKALSDWVEICGYLCCITPPAWRRLCGERSNFKGLFELMTRQNHMLKLTMKDKKAGQLFFNCGTRFDYYLICRSSHSGWTHITYLDGLQTDEFLFNKPWLANEQSDDLDFCIAGENDEKAEIEISTIRDFKDESCEEYCKRLVHATNISGVRYKYGKATPPSGPKVIIGLSGIKGQAVIDYNGDLGITQGAIAIHESNPIRLQIIKQAIESERFTKMMKICELSTFGFSKNLFPTFRKLFYGIFLPEP